MAVLNSRTYKQIEWRLYHYHELRRQVEDSPNQRLDVLHRSRTPATPGGGGVAHRSDPTASKVLQIVQIEDQQAEAKRWVEVIEQVIRRYGRNPQDRLKGQLLELRYFAQMDEGYISQRLCIDRSTFYFWKAEIVTYAALIAAQHGLLKVS